MKIHPYGDNRYQADAGLIEGRRLRQVFDSKPKAELWLRHMARQREADKLGVADIDLATAADAKRAATLLAGKISLLEAAQFWNENHCGSDTAKLSTLRTAFLQHLETGNAREDYLDGMAGTLKHFIREVGDRLIGDCTTALISNWLQRPEWSRGTFRNRRRELSVFFNWCVRQGVLPKNPVDRIPSPKLDDHRPEVLTVEQTEKLLNGLQGSERAYFAIALFAGLRPAEIDRLTWAEVKLDRAIIELRSEQSKQRSRRLVTIEPALAAWLGTVPSQADGPILVCDKFQLMKRACTAAGLERWPRNVCRHSYASYHLARWESADRTALQMGHTSTTMLFKHYREVVTREDAQAFWSIFPPNHREEPLTT